MVAAPIDSVVSILLEALANSPGTVDQINQVCIDSRLPPAFLIDDDRNPQILENSDYRLEGFGLILGLPPKLSFYVHYRPGKLEHVALKKFTVPLDSQTWTRLSQLLRGREFPI